MSVLSLLKIFTCSDVLCIESISCVCLLAEDTNVPHATLH